MIKQYFRFDRERSKHEDTTDNKSASIVYTILSIHKSRGVQGFYRGIVPVLLGNLISQFIYFFWYENLKESSNFFQSKTIKYSFCSLLAGIISSICANPFWVIQTLMLKSSGSLTEIINSTYQKEGIRAFFKGLSTSICLVMNPLINFLIYESYKDWATAFFNSNSNPIIYFIGGALGKFTATIATYPYQLIRTKSHIVVNPNYGKMIKHIYYHEGLIGFYRGLLPKLSQTVLSNAFCIMFYEEIFQYLKHIAIFITNSNPNLEAFKYSCALIALLIVSTNLFFKKEELNKKKIDEAYLTIEI